MTQSKAHTEDIEVKPVNGLRGLAIGSIVIVELSCLGTMNNTTDN